jgi:hypothetical protein
MDHYDNTNSLGKYSHKKNIALKVTHPPKHRSAKGERGESQGAFWVNLADERGTEKRVYN